MTQVSMKDVAERAGVSTATVSHVINQTRFVREETRAKVLEAIEGLNYQPNALARGLVTKSTQTIGLIISDITNAFFTEVVRGVEDTLNAQRYHTILCNTDKDADREDEYLRLLMERQIDGLIIAPTGIRSERLIRMAANEVPIVLLDRRTPDLDAPLVDVENKAGAIEAVQYLLQLGHRQIGVLTGVETISTQALRVEGYRQALQRADIPINEALIVRADPRSYHHNPADETKPLSKSSSTLRYNDHMANSVAQAVQQLLSLPTPPTALFVTNNQMTLGALQALKAQEYRCPEDISLISFDDHDWAPLFSPAITVVRQPTYRLGQTAAELLFQLIANKSTIISNGYYDHQEKSAVISPSLPVEFIIRESCQPRQI